MASDMTRSSDLDSAAFAKPCIAEEDLSSVQASGAVGDPSHSRIEALIEQQNALMTRQLQLAEESCQRKASMPGQFRGSHEFLKTLDPHVRGIFAVWHKEFRVKLGLYVAQSKLATKYEGISAKTELMQPFLQEASTPWNWSPFYRSVAKPIGGVDPILADGTPVGLVDADGKARKLPLAGAERPNLYDIDCAFSELRRRHAWQVQNFVIAHQKDCLAKIIEDLALPNQLRTLEAKLDASPIEYSGFCQPQTKPKNQEMEGQAKMFVELVYREEMPQAERRLKEQQAPSAALITVIRIICFIVMVLSVMTMSHELLMKLFASLFALGCGMAILWEDLIMCTLQLLLGATRCRLRAVAPMEQLGSLPQRVMLYCPKLVW